MAKLTLRDGSRRTVKAGDIISGANIAKLAREAIFDASLRAAETNEEGLCLEDVLRAISTELENCARMLTPVNCHHHVANLPQDVDVVGVEPAHKQVAPVHRYVELTP